MVAKITRFKDTGKWYEDIEVEVPDGLELFQIWDFLRAHKRTMYDESMIWLVDVPGHKNNHPRLLTTTK